MKSYIPKNRNEFRCEEMSDDYEWFMKKSADGKLGKYAGKWVVIINKRVVANGENLEAILRKIKREDPKAVPFVAHISEPGIFIY